ncbi:MAG: rod shape-determining protein MreC [Brevinematia bacterium]
MEIKSKKGQNPLITYSIVLLISILLLIFNSITFYINTSIKFVSNVILYPFTFLTSFISQSTEAIKNNFENFSRSLEKIKELERENEELKEKVALLEYYQTENRNLSILLEITKRINYKVEVANIISSDFDSGAETITIDKGVANGITKGMPVIAYFMGNIAIIGVVKESFLATSIVETIFSPNLNIGVMLEVSQDVGILSGNGKINGTATIKYISQSIEVKVGTEKVFTSSKSQIFPPGILVGYAILTKKNENAKFQEVVVKPAIDPKNISRVMVIKSF